jgi:hypothetical protein
MRRFIKLFSKKLKLKRWRWTQEELMPLCSLFPMFTAFHAEFPEGSRNIAPPAGLTRRPTKSEVQMHVFVEKGRESIRDN